jgi:ethanolamine permease
VLWLNPSVAGVGSHALATSGEPLLDGFKAIYGEGIAKALALVAVLGWWRASTPSSSPRAGRSIR